jgi:hypothetical protein
MKGEILDEDFGVDVTVTARFATKHYPAFEHMVTERTAGRLQPEIVESSDGTVMPLGSLGGEKLNL